MEIVSWLGPWGMFFYPYKARSSLFWPLISGKKFFSGFDLLFPSSVIFRLLLSGHRPSSFLKFVTILPLLQRRKRKKRLGPAACDVALVGGVFIFQTRWHSFVSRRSEDGGERRGETATVREKMREREEELLLCSSPPPLLSSLSSSSSRGFVPLFFAGIPAAFASAAVVGLKMAKRETKSVESLFRLSWWSFLLSPPPALMSWLKSC